MGSSVFVGIQRILVAYDASPHAEHALNIALSMAADMKARLFVVAVIRPPEPAESAEFNAVLEDGRERYERSFAPLRDRARQKEIELETDIVVGHPAEQIIHRAETI
jgi:nucleotide-binding universal stress UspA family protein